MVLRKLFARAEPALPRQHRLPDGERIYAIGDIHGRVDCLDILLDRIARDDADRACAKTKLVFLGDLTDRGPDSREVVERAMQIDEHLDAIFLMGNHEEILIRTWEGDRSAAGLFNRVGGRETLMSYGVDPHDYDKCDLGELAALTERVVPREHIAFMRRFEDSHVAGNYLFVHAGIRPGIALEMQNPSDLRWIRRDFLDDATDHGVMIVHGHSITDAVDERANRIGIDTGAFSSGQLTALGLEGAERWYLAT